MYFPYEEHVCELHIRPVTDTFAFKSLSAIPPNRYTPHFQVENIKFNGVKSRNDMSVYAKGVLKLYVNRLIGFYVVSVFIPSFFLLAVNSIVLWAVDAHDYRLATSIFVASSFSLMWMTIVINGPTSSTIRAIDVWMSFCITHSLLHIFVNIIVKTLISAGEQPQSRSLSTMSSRPVSRLRQIKPMDTINLYDALLAKMASDENENTWTIAYWVMFCARIVSPALVLLFMVSFWPFLAYYS